MQSISVSSITQITKSNTVVDQRINRGDNTKNNTANQSDHSENIRRVTVVVNHSYNINSNFDPINGSNGMEFASTLFLDSTNGTMISIVTDTIGASTDKHPLIEEKLKLSVSHTSGDETLKLNTPSNYMFSLNHDDNKLTLKSDQDVTLSNGKSSDNISGDKNQFRTMKFSDVNPKVTFDEWTNIYTNSITTDQNDNLFLISAANIGQIHFKNAIELDSEHTKYKFYSDLYKSDVDKVPNKVVENLITQEQDENKKSTLGLLELNKIETVDYHLIQTNMTYQKLLKSKDKSREYFKLIELQTNQETICKNLDKNDNDLPSTNTIWKIKNRDITAVSVGEEKHQHYFAAIDPSILDNLETLTKSQFTIALTKGFVKRAKGQNGLKYLQSGLLELKNKSDCRLFSDTIFRSKKGDLLIWFDRQFNHTSIENFLAKTKMHYIDI